MAMQQASIEIGDYKALTEADRTRRANDLFKATQDKVEIFVVGNKVCDSICGHKLASQLYVAVCGKPYHRNCSEKGCDSS